MDRDTLIAHVQTLTDRAAISDLLFDFAYALDSKNWTAYANTFSDAGELVLPWANEADGRRIGHQGRDGMAAFVERGFSRWFATHHMSTNHRIRVDGDNATSHSYCQAVHRWDANDPTAFWLFAGWYRNRLERTAGGWRFTHVQLDGVWEMGAPPTPHL